MKKALNEWKKFLKENVENEDRLLDIVRDIFFGSYNSWEPEYKKLHDDEFEALHKQLTSNAEKKFKDEKKINKVTSLANIGLCLYWSDNPRHGAGDQQMVSFIVQKKLETLESMISKEEQEVLKSGLMEQIIDNVRGDRSELIYPTTLAVSVGVINGLRVDDAYMTSGVGMRESVIPILRKAGYYSNTEKPKAPKTKRRKQKEPKLSMADMKAMMDKFGR